MATRELLAVHKTVAKFDGLKKQQCMHMTSLCPDRCNHGGTNAVFSIKKYLHYEKPGQYGDEKTDKHCVKLEDDVERSGLTAERKSLLDSLKEGDVVLLSWNHDYVNRHECYAPERPITELKKISEEEANKL